MTSRRSGRLLYVSVSWLLHIFIAVVFFAKEALADTVVVEGKFYDIILYQGQSFDENASILRTAPWWGSVLLANDFANAYSAQVGAQDFSSGLDAVYFGFGEGTFDFEGRSILTVNSMVVDETDGSAIFKSSPAGNSSPSVSFVSATLAPDAVTIPEINAGSPPQVLLILFAFWLVVRRRESPSVSEGCVTFLNCRWVTLSLCGYNHLTHN